MASSQAVYIKSGDQPRAFQWGNPITPSYSTTAVAPSLPMYKESVYSWFQAVVSGTGAVTATVTVQGTEDDNTGRGFLLGGENAPGFLAVTTAASATVTAVAGGIFTQALIGGFFVSPNVPQGTTVTAVAANGLTLTLSSGVGVVAGTAQSTIFANNWAKTALGTLTLTATTTDNDGVTVTSPVRYVRLNVTAITGTGAAVLGWMGV